MIVRQRLVTFAHIMRPAAQVSLFEGTFPSDVLASIDPDRDVERYNKTWRFGRPHKDDHFIYGKLGFLQLGQEKEAGFDKEKKDWVSREVIHEQGNFAHFVIDPERQFLAFEERPPKIKRGPFLGAFRALVNQTEFEWEVETLKDPTEFEAWVGKMDRVLRVKAVLRPPNPSWRESTEPIREIIEPTNADELQVIAKVADDGGGSLQIEGSVLGSAAQYVADGYGEIAAVGRKGNRQTRFSTKNTVKTEAIVETSDDSSQSIWAKIGEILRRQD